MKRISKIFLIIVIFSFGFTPLDPQFSIESPRSQGTETVYIGLFTQELTPLEFSNYRVYMNSTLLVFPTFTANVSDVANISVYDLANTLLNSTNFTIVSGDNHLALRLDTILITNNADHAITAQILELNTSQDYHYYGEFYTQYIVSNITNHTDVNNWTTFDPVTTYSIDFNETVSLVQYDLWFYAEAGSNFWLGFKFNSQTYDRGLFFRSDGLFGYNIYGSGFIQAIGYFQHDQWNHFSAQYNFEQHIIRFYINETLVYENLTDDSQYGSPNGEIRGILVQKSYDLDLFFDGIDYSYLQEYSPQRNLKLNLSYYQANVTNYTLPAYSSLFIHCNLSNNYVYRLIDPVSTILQENFLSNLEITYDQPIPRLVELVYYNTDNEKLDFYLFRSYYYDYFLPAREIYSPVFWANVGENFTIRVYDVNNQLVNQFNFIVSYFQDENQINVTLELIAMKNLSSEFLNIEFLRNYNYQGTHSFDLEIANLEPTQYFDDFSDLDRGYVAIVQENWTDVNDETHGKVLTFQREMISWPSSTSQIQTNFTNQTHGVIELWFNSDDTKGSFRIRENTTLAQSISIPANITLNDWTVFRLEFDCVADTYSYYIDEINYGSGSFSTPVGNITNFQIDSGTPNTGNTYNRITVDSIDFNWTDGYSLNRIYQLNHSLDLFNDTSPIDWEQDIHLSTASSNLTSWNETNPAQSVVQEAITDQYLDQRKNSFNITGNSTSQTEFLYNLTENQESFDFEFWFYSNLSSTTDPLNLTIFCLDENGTEVSGITIGPQNDPDEFFFRFYSNLAGWYQPADKDNIFVTDNSWNFIHLRIRQPGGGSGEFDTLVFTPRITPYVDEIAALGFSEANITAIQVIIGISNETILSDFSISSDTDHYTAMTFEEDVLANPGDTLDFTYSVNIYSETQAFFDNASYIYRMKDLFGEILDSGVINVTNREILYLPPDLVDVVVNLIDSEGETLEFLSFKVFGNGTQILSQNFQAVVNTYLNISITDLFDEFITSTLVPVNSSDNFVIITINSHDLKILSDLRDIGFINITKGAITIDEFVVPTEILKYELLQGNYTVQFVDDSNQTNILSIDLQADRLIILNTTFHEVYFSIFDQDGLGLGRNMFKFLIDLELKDLGFNFLQGDIHQITVKDYFDNILVNQNVNFSGLTEYNIQITVHTLIINNNLTESLEIEVYRTSISDTKYTVVVPAQSGVQIRLLPDQKLTIKAFYINGTLFDDKEITLDKEVFIVSFGFFEKVGAIELEAITLVDYIVSIAVIGSAIWIFIQAGETSPRRSVLSGTRRVL